MKQQTSPSPIEQESSRSKLYHEGSSVLRSSSSTTNRNDPINNRKLELTTQGFLCIALMTLLLLFSFFRLGYNCSSFYPFTPSSASRGDDRMARKESWHLYISDNFYEEAHDDGVQDEGYCVRMDKNLVEDDDGEEENDFIRSAGGQLSLDLKGIEWNTVRSQHKLLQIMTKLSQCFHLELISYYCREDSTSNQHLEDDNTDTCDIDSGVKDINNSENSTSTRNMSQCIGIFSDGGHISIHSWPTEPRFGEVWLDVFLTSAAAAKADNTNMDGDKYNFLSKFVLRTLMKDMMVVTEALLEGREGTSSSSTYPSVPRVRWGIRRRAQWPRFSQRSDRDDALQTLDRRQISVASIQTEFQTIEIIDEMSSRRERSMAYALEHDPEYLRDNPALFDPDRIVFMDDVTQSHKIHDAGYHESLVHPTLFAHPNPKRVAIIGGGEGATLREVLKHKTIQEVVMIEIDPAIMDAARVYLLEWSDCGFLQHDKSWTHQNKAQNDSTSCFDDPRATVYAEDAIRWFIDRYGLQTNLGTDLVDDKAKDNDTLDHPKFDVIIMDALDPEEAAQEFATILYKNNAFLSSLYNALNPDGIFVSQVGATLLLNEPDETYSNPNRVRLEEGLADVGFRRIRSYISSHAGFEVPWTFYIAFRSIQSEVNWFSLSSSDARLSIEVQRRMIPTNINGGLPLKYFDSATMSSFRYPTKASEVVFCHRRPLPEVCDKARIQDALVTIPQVADGGGDGDDKALFDRPTTTMPPDFVVQLGVDTFSLVTDLLVQNKNNGVITNVVSKKAPFWDYIVKNLHGRRSSSSSQFGPQQQLQDLILENDHPVYNPAFDRSTLTFNSSSTI